MEEESLQTIPIDGVIDLHTFRPSEVASVVEEYIEACYEAGLPGARVIHGKGIGALKQTVERVLARHPRVESFCTADESSGGWGATLVQLRSNSDRNRPNSSQE